MLGGAQAALFLALPFASVGGESALRFDVPSATLHCFGGRVATSELIILLPATLAAAFLFLLVTLAFGRVWCGWSCPQTLLADLTPLAAAPRSAGRTGEWKRWRRPLGLAICAAVAAAFSAATLWYFVPPAAFVARLAAGRLGPSLAGAWAGLGAALFLDLAFLRGRFCATACPYARLQGVLFDRWTLAVAYDAARAPDCVDCGACVRVCPTGIDIRGGLQMECIACAECVDACAPIMARLRRPPRLVAYFFGEPGARRRLVRPATVALAAATALSLCATAAAAAAAARTPLDLVAASSADFAPRAAGGGRTLEALQLALENRSDAPLAVRLTLEGPGLSAALQPSQVTLAPREHRALRALAAIRGLPAGGAVATVAAVAERPGLPPLRVSQPITLVSPETR